MIKTAQNGADRYHLTREEIDGFALRSHRQATAARDSGRLAAEIHAVDIPGTRQEPARTFEHDEMILGDTTAEKLARLPAQPNTTQMTAGNSSPLSDGASAVVLASGDAARSLGLEPLARMVASATYALDPQYMGIAPAFAAQALGVLRELPTQLGGFEVPDDRVNPNGGAVAIGHPFGSSGTRHVLTLATELRWREVRYGVLGFASGPAKGSLSSWRTPGLRKVATSGEPRPVTGPASSPLGFRRNGGQRACSSTAADGADPGGRAPEGHGGVRSRR